MRPTHSSAECCRPLLRGTPSQASTHTPWSVIRDLPSLVGNRNIFNDRHHRALRSTRNGPRRELRPVTGWTHDGPGPRSWLMQRWLAWPRTATANPGRTGRISPFIRLRPGRSGGPPPTAEWQTRRPGHKSLARLAIQFLWMALDHPGTRGRGVPGPAGLLAGVSWLAPPSVSDPVRSWPGRRGGGSR
jgi:hypothetical protein